MKKSVKLFVVAALAAIMVLAPVTVKLHVYQNTPQAHAQTSNPVHAYKDCSVIITTGGVSQPAAPSDGNRNALFIQNVSATDNIFFNFGSPAAVNGAGSIELSPGQAYSVSNATTGYWSTDQESINVAGATSGDAFTCKAY